MKIKTLNIFLIFSILFCNLFLGVNASKIVFAEEVEEEFTITNCVIELENIDKYNYINIFSDNITLLSTEQNKIAFLGGESTKTFENTGTNDGQIIAPKFVKKIADDKFAVYDINRIQIFDADFNYVKRFAYIYDDTLPLALGGIVSISTDYAGNLYMLDITNNLVLKLNIDDDIIHKISIDGANITDNSKISVNANGNKLALINVLEQNVIYDLTNNNIVVLNDDSYDDAIFDCMDNLFLFKKSGTSTQVTKFACDDPTNTTTKSIDLTYNSLDMDLETGKLYLLNSQVQYVQNEQFFASASTQINPVDLKSTLPHKSFLNVCTTKNSAKLYSTCVSFASSVVLQDDTKVVVLKDEMPQNKNMSYCLVTQNNTELTGYIETENLNKIVSSFAEKQYKTICQNVDVLSYPSINSGVVKTLNNPNDTITVVGDVCSYLGSNNQAYFEVKIDDKIAYVEQRFLARTDLYEIQQIQTEPVQTNQNQFIAMVISVVCLFVVTLFVCFVIGKKAKE